MNCITHYLYYLAVGASNPQLDTQILYFMCCVIYYVDYITVLMLYKRHSFIDHYYNIQPGVFIS